jgi:hypothetical protein
VGQSAVGFGTVIAEKNAESLSQESTMKKKTLLLFQLLLAVFAFYSVLKYSGNQRLLVPLFCLFGMILVGKLENLLAEGDGKKEYGMSRVSEKIDDEVPFKPADTLIKSKNVLLLIDAMHYLFKDLGLSVSRSPDQRSIDRVLRVPDDRMTFSLKVLGDVAELPENWDSLKELAELDQGEGGRNRLLLIGSNTLQEGEEVKPKFVDFSANSQNLLSSKSIVAMTTLTLYKIHLLCTTKSVDPSVVFDLIHQHPGGVFRLEQYMKRSSQAA